MWVSQSGYFFASRKLYQLSDSRRVGRRSKNYIVRWSPEKCYFPRIFRGFRGFPRNFLGIVIPGIRHDEMRILRHRPKNRKRKVSASFCTKNYQNPFSSLRERAVWSSIVDIIIHRKFTWRSRMTSISTSSRTIIIIATRVENLTSWSFRSTMLLQTVRSRRLLNGFW